MPIFSTHSYTQCKIKINRMCQWLVLMSTLPMVQDYILYGIPEIRSCNFKFYTCKSYKNTSMFKCRASWQLIHRLLTTLANWSVSNRVSILDWESVLAVFNYRAYLTM